MPNDTQIPKIEIGGFYQTEPGISAGFHPTYSLMSGGWAPTDHINPNLDPRFTDRVSLASGRDQWLPDLEFGQPSNPRFYTYGPMGGGPDGPKLQITGSIVMDPQSNIFIGNPEGPGMSKYPEEWTLGDDDGLLITRNLFVNNSNDTYYRFGDHRSYVKFANRSYLDLGRFSTVGYKDVDNDDVVLFSSNGALHIRDGSRIYGNLRTDGVLFEQDHDSSMSIQRLNIVNGSSHPWYPNHPGSLSCAGDASFTGEASFTADTRIDKLYVNRVTDQPSGCVSPLMIRQAGTNFGHRIMIDRLYQDGSSGGWNIGLDSDNKLTFQYFVLDTDGELVNGYWNNADAGRGYIAKQTDVGQLTFTGQHRSIPQEGTVADFEDKVGLIVVSTGKYSSMGEDDITINDAMPKVELSSVANDKRVFGVVSNVEDTDSDERSFTQGIWGTSVDKPAGDDRVIINSVGEGAMWVTDINGNLENGDYITSSDLAGYGMRQDDDLLHNYTVAKITMDCDFDLNSTEYRCEQIGPYKRAFVGVTYHCG